MKNNMGDIADYINSLLNKEECDHEWLLKYTGGKVFVQCSKCSKICGEE